MPRPTVEVDKNKLDSIIKELESKNTYNTQSALYEAVSKAYGDEKVTPSVVMLRIKQFGLEIKTQKAKISADVFRERINNAITGDDTIKPKAKQTTHQLLEYADSKEKEKYLKVAKSTLRGSRKACIKMMCLQCTNWQPTEIKYCPCTGCALWLFRPYQ